ncbi:MAG TPA: FeoA family protein, partial [Longimicrobiales bacterium]|nr:FeoA family protein [Longimicrobiales bacterium]
PDLEMEERDHRPLSELAVGQRATVSEVGDEDSAMLRHFAELGLFPETHVEVLAVAPFDGPITLRVGDSEQSIGRLAASRVFVADVREATQ